MSRKGRTKPKHKHSWANGRCAALRDGAICGHKQPVKGVNGHAKGGKAEREVASILQPWWQRLEGAAEFCRTPQSGGWGKASGTKVAEHFNACGDLMTTAARFPFCVEVKWHEAWSYDNLVAGKPTAPWGWWLQCLEAADTQSNVPMMWMRKGRIRATRESFPWIVWLPLSFIIERRLSEPDIQWSGDQLYSNGVDYGDVLPVAYFYDRFLQMAPQRMATPL